MPRWLQQRDRPASNHPSPSSSRPTPVPHPAAGLPEEPPSPRFRAIRHHPRAAIQPGAVPAPTDRAPARRCRWRQPHSPTAPERTFPCLRDRQAPPASDPPWRASPARRSRRAPPVDSPRPPAIRPAPPKTPPPRYSADAASAPRRKPVRARVYRIHHRNHRNQHPPSLASLQGVIRATPAF